jgi:hypothetical protein
MSVKNPDALTELIRTLREQLARKDEHIASMEELLKEAMRQISTQQSLIARLLDHPRSHLKDATTAEVATPTETPEQSTGVLPGLEGEPLPQREPAVVEAHAVVAAREMADEKPASTEMAPSSAEEEPCPITLRLDRNELRKAHQALSGTGKGVWKKWLASIRG